MGAGAEAGGAGGGDGAGAGGAGVGAGAGDAGFSAGAETGAGGGLTIRGATATGLARPTRAGRGACGARDTGGRSTAGAAVACTTVSTTRGGAAMPTGCSPLRPTSVDGNTTAPARTAAAANVVPSRDQLALMLQPPSAEYLFRTSSAEGAGALKDNK